MPNCTDCNSGSISLQGTWFSNNNCEENDCGGNTVNSLCVIYNGSSLTCSGVNSGDTLEVALQKIDEQICSVIGDYSTYNMNCLPAWWGTAITTEEEFVDAITAYACNINDRFTTFVEETYQQDQINIDSRLDDLEVPGITCASASVVNTDTLQQVLTKYCSKFVQIDNALNISSVVWNNCLTVVGTPASIAAGFQLVEDQICDIFDMIGDGAVLPVFNNYGSCIGGTSSDSLVTTIGLIKTRLCLTPTFDNDNLTASCTTIPSSSLDLEGLLQNMLDNIDTAMQNLVSFDNGDFTVVATDPMNPCAGVTVSLATSINQDRLVAVSVADLSPGTLIDKVDSSGSISVTNNSDTTLRIDIADGDNGDIVVSSSGTVWTIDNQAVTFAKIQNVNNGVLIGRSTSGSGSVEQITVGSGLLLSSGTLSVVSSTTRISSLIEANSSNTINNGNYLQEWQWNSLSGVNGLKLTSNSTAGTTQYLLYVAVSGAWTSSSASSAAAYFESSKTGTNNTNNGIVAGASGGTANYGVVCWGAGGQWGTSPGASIYAQGRMRIDGQIDTYGSTSGIVTIKPAASAGTWTFTLPTTAGSAGQFLSTNGSGVTSWASAATLTEGTYTPTATPGTNVSSVTPGVTRYSMVGNYVYVWGVLSATATSATTLSDFEITLPVASNLANNYDLAGTGATADSSAVQILANTTNDTAKFSFYPLTDSSTTYSFHFSYKVI